MTTSPWLSHPLSPAVPLASGQRSGRRKQGHDATDPFSSGIPITLLAIEAEAEVAYDDALVSDFAGVRSIARVILLEWATYRSRLIDTRVDESWLEEMDGHVANLLMRSRACGSEVDLARAANEVGRWVGEGLRAYYRTTLPAAVIAMGYLGREILLDATAFDLRAAVTHAGSLRTVWLGLRSTAEMIGGGDRAACIESAVESVTIAIDRGDAAQIRDLAETLLAEVTLLEAVFDD